MATVKKRRRPPIILASASPRRARILTDCGIPFRTRISAVEEITDSRKDPRRSARHNARLKARAVAATITNGYVIGVDTVVAYGGHMIGKPRDVSEADFFLKRFSGRSLVVFSGVCLIDTARDKTFTAVESTRVRVKKISPRMRSCMLARLEPLDRAGGFSIEGIGAFIFDTVEGSFYNVLGLPMGRLYALFQRARVDLLDYL